MNYERLTVGTSHVCCAKKFVKIWRKKYSDDYVKKMNSDIISNKIFDYKYFINTNNEL